MDKLKKRGDNMANKIFDIQNSEAIKDLLLKNIDAEYKAVNISTLGGNDYVALLLSISLNKKENWQNGIFENSLYYHFIIDNNGEVENFSKNYQLKKIRKKTLKNIMEVIAYINENLKKEVLK